LHYAPVLSLATAIYPKVRHGRDRSEVLIHVQERRFSPHGGGGKNFHSDGIAGE
jgi:hypothetical protein